MKIKAPRLEIRNIQIRRSMGKICFYFSFLLLLGGYFSIPGTNSLFSHEDLIYGNQIGFGKWIPEIKMDIHPFLPDGKEGCYETNPCITLYSSLENTKIYYSLNDEWFEYGNSCILLDDGEWDFSAYAVNNENDDWKSETITHEFDVCAKGDVAEEGDVVINELMWMGSDDDSDDEWIELRNMTDHKIDISNWNIENGGSGSGHIEMPHGYTIEANGYFLLIKRKWNKTEINLNEELEKNDGITHVQSMNLKDGGEKLTLRDKKGNVIDVAWKNKDWPAGKNGDEKKSMERNDDPEDGTEQENWHTCEDASCNDEEFWRDGDGKNYGTPGAENESEIEDNSKNNNSTKNNTSEEEPIRQAGDNDYEENLEIIDSLDEVGKPETIKTIKKDNDDLNFDEIEDPPTLLQDSLDSSDSGT